MVIEAQEIRKWTKPARHRIVRAIAPKLFLDAKTNRLLGLSAVPRPMILFVGDLMGRKALVGAEIGVAEGTNAESIMESLNMRKLYLIDPYRPYKSALGEKIDYGRYLHLARQKMSRYGDKVEFVVKDSDDAVDDLPDDLDFVYIDGNHNYEFVKRDIGNYYPKMVPGGVLGGHDFFGYYIGLCMAVFEFVTERDLRLFSLKLDWWVMKQREPDEEILRSFSSLSKSLGK